MKGVPLCTELWTCVLLAQILTVNWCSVVEKCDQLVLNCGLVFGGKALKCVLLVLNCGLASVPWSSTKMCSVAQRTVDGLVFPAKLLNSIPCLLSAWTAHDARERKREENRRYYLKLQQDPARFQRLKQQQKEYRQIYYKNMKKKR